MEPRTKVLRSDFMSSARAMTPFMVLIRREGLGGWDRRSWSIVGSLKGAQRWRRAVRISRRKARVDRMGSEVGGKGEARARRMGWLGGNSGDKASNRSW
jgi:hypothetical protein